MHAADPLPTPTPPPLPPLRILVADDEESMRHFVQRGLTRLGHQVTTAEDGDQAVARWLAGAFDLLVTDLKMPHGDGLSVLGRVRSHDPDAVVVLMSAQGTVATAVEAMQLGAADFVTKPFTIEELWLRLERAWSLRATTLENRQLKALLQDPAADHGLCAHSPAMRELLRQLDLLRGSSATVLLTGESGTGKGLVAKALHLASARAGAPFVALNCAAMPDTLVESELFGHEPGAFTGARTRKQGLLHRAHRGTLFLDEIGDMSLSAQAKIERFLQDREFLPLGGQTPQQVDVRILAATNRDLPGLARDGAFRTELLWRLDVIQLRVPPLRERREDVPPLVGQFLRQKATGPVPRLSPDALGALCAYGWPGNVRELENVIERMVVMAGQRLDLGTGDLPPELRGDTAGDTSDDRYEAARERFDRLYFTNLLMATGGSITAAAQRAGISRGHLHRRLRELGCDPTSAREASRTAHLDEDDDRRVDS